MKHLIVAMLFLPILAYAHLPYTLEECKQFSQIVEAMGTARDANAPQDELKQATAHIAVEMSKRKTFVQDEGDMLMLINAVDVVYALKDMPPKQLQAASYDDCVKELVPGLMTEGK